MVKRILLVLILLSLGMVLFAEGTWVFGGWRDFGFYCISGARHRSGDTHYFFKNSLTFRYWERDFHIPPLGTGASAEVKYIQPGTIYFVTRSQSKDKRSWSKDFTITQSGRLEIRGYEWVTFQGWKRRSGPHSFYYTKDSTPPLAPVFNSFTTDASESFYLYSPDNFQYYFNPEIASDVILHVASVEDRGDGGQRAVGLNSTPYVYIVDTNRNGQIDSGDTKIPVATSQHAFGVSGSPIDIKTQWWARDILDNRTAVQETTLIRDAEPPVLNSESFSVEPSGPDSYIVTIIADVTDDVTGSEKSGVQQVSMQFRGENAADLVKQNDGNDSALPVDNGYPTLGFTKNETSGMYEAKVLLMANQSIDGTFVLEDNVANKADAKTVTLSFPGMPALEFPEPGEADLSWKTIPYINSQGDPELNLVFRTGSSFNDSSTGFTALTFSVQNQDFDLYAMTPEVLVTADPNVSLVRYVLPLTSVENHGSYPIAGTYGLPAAASLAWGEGASITVPNLLLGPDNDIALQIDPANYDAFSLDSTALSLGVPDAYTDVYFGGSIRIILKTLTDNEGDDLKLYYWDSQAWVPGVYEDTPEGTVMVLDLAESVENIRVVEEWNNGSFENVVSYRFLKDTSLLVDDNNYRFEVETEATGPMALPASSDESFSVVVSENPVAVDPSGIDSVMVFNADSLVVNGVLNTDAFDTANAVDITQNWDSANSTWTGQIDFDRTNNAVEEPHYVGLYMEDGAGNKAFTFRKVLIDKKPPRLFNIFESTARVAEAGDYEIVYQLVGGQVRLVSDTAAKDDSYSESGVDPISLTAYDMQWELQSGSPATIAGSGTESDITFSLDPSIAPNQVITANLTLTDFVGNSTTQQVLFYSPATLSGSVDKYLTEAGQQQDGTGGYTLDWTPNNTPEAATYSLYRDDTSGNYVPVVGFSDSSAEAHQELSYQLYGVNGSGYMNESDGLFIDFSRTVANSEPKITTISFQGSVSNADESVVLGLDSLITLVTGDYDGDALFLSAQVNGEVWSVVPLPSGSDSFLLSDLTNDTYQWTNSESYSVTFLVEDRWVDTAGVPVVSDAMTFHYDTQAPSVLEYVVEKLPGYDIGSGDLIIHVKDLFTDIATVDAELVNGTALSVEPIEESPGYYKLSGLPTGQSIQLSVTTGDMLGNVGTIQLSGIARDAVAPSITSAGTDLNIWNDLYVNNQPFLPLNIQWSDDSSGLGKIGIQIKNDTDVIDRFLYESGELAYQNSSGVWSGAVPVSFVPVESGSYEVWVQVTDHAGNLSDWIEINRKVAFDYVSPQASFTEITGFVRFRGQNFLTDLEPAFTLESSDGTVVAAQNVHLLDANEMVLSNDVSGSSVTALVTDGEKYGLQGVVSDVAGNTGSSDILWFTVDKSAPGTASVVYSSTVASPVYAGAPYRFTLDADDATSGIAKVYLKIGQQDVGDSTLFLANISELIPLPYYGENYEYSLVLPKDVSPGTYEIRINLEDGAGNTTGFFSPGNTTITFADGGERIVVQDYLAVSNNPRRLQAGWSYVGTGLINFYQYRIVKVSDGTAITDWIDTFDTFATVNLTTDLENNSRYAFEVKATFNDGTELPVFVSPGVRIDTGLPVARNLELPRFSTSSQLIMGWELEETESALVEIETVLEAYEKDSQGNLVLEAFEDENGQTVTRPVLEKLAAVALEPILQTQSYTVDLSAIDLPAKGIIDGDELFVRLKATDAGGNLLDTGMGAVVIDDSVASLPNIIDQGDFVNPDKNILSFHWNASSADTHSGINSYRYQLVEPGELVSEDSWVDLPGDATGLSVSGTTKADGTTVVLALELQNGAGLKSIGYSNGIVIDRSKPEIPAVFVSKVNEGSPLEYLAAENFQLHMSSVDTQSGVAGYEYQLGLINNDGVWQEHSDVLFADVNQSIVSLSISDIGLSPGDRFAFKVQSINGAGDYALLPAMTVPVLYDPMKPDVEWLRPIQSGEAISVSWALVPDAIPAESLVLSLRQSGSTVHQVFLEGSAESYKIDASAVSGGISDGLYLVQLEVTNTEGAKSDIDEASVASVLYDTTAPVFDLAQFDKYIADHMGYEFRGDDGGSGIAEYRYRLGLIGEPGLLTQGWISNLTKRKTLAGEINFDQDLPGGSDSINHLDAVVLSYQIRDAAGNWSFIEFGEPALADLTPPAVASVEQDPQISIQGEPWINSSRYITGTSTVERLGFQLSDSDSGIVAYRYGFVEYGQTVSDTVDWSDFVSIQDDPLFSVPTRLTDVTVTRQEGFTDTQVWVVLFQSLNRSGLVSEVFESPPFLVDLAPPEISLNTESGVTTEADSQQGQRPVFNDTGDLVMNLDQEAGEAVVVEYVLLSPEGVSISSGSYLQSRTEPALVIPFTPIEGTGGLYVVELDVTDHGSRTAKSVQEVRYNASPTIAIADKETRPGETLRFGPDDQIHDSDGIESITVRVMNLDGTVVDEQSVVSAADWSVVLSHSSTTVSETNYMLEVTAKDLFGQEAMTEAEVTVKNTRTGTLFENEYWSGEHIITGPVIIPAGVQLTVAPGTLISAVPAVEGVELPGITVMSGGILIHQGAAEYKVVSLDPDAVWDGLAIYGNAELNGITVKDAKRAIGIIAPQAEAIDGILLENNEIGIHLFGTGTEIRNGQFINNRFYAVKEDGAAGTVLVNNVFKNNGWEYYRDGGALLGVDEINSLAGNSGNIAE